MNEYTQVNVKKQIDVSMTNKVHDSHLILLLFLNLMKWGIFYL